MGELLRKVAQTASDAESQVAAQAITNFLNSCV